MFPKISKSESGLVKIIKPSEVASIAKKVEKQNLQFRSFLKFHADEDELDLQFLELHNELFKNYDCSKCANCCKEYELEIDEFEVGKITQFLGLTKEEWVEKYSVAESGFKYEMKHKPCAFLDEYGKCTIEKCKPQGCVDYPFTNKPDRLSSMYSMIEHASVCPVVFEILERLKKLYRFRG